jgi:hypothetical protein
MLNLPAHAQSRILAEQKYPKAAPQIFRTPFYQQALTGIRGYYKNGKSVQDIDAARAKIDAMKSESRRVNKLRVLNAFGKSDLAQRDLKLLFQQKIKHTLGTVEPKVSPDLTATENGLTRYLYLHCRGEHHRPGGSTVDDRDVALGPRKFGSQSPHRADRVCRPQQRKDPYGCEAARQHGEGRSREHKDH